MLTRKYKMEDIEVRFHCQDMNSDYSSEDFDNAVEAEEGDEEMPEDSNGIDFSVTIKRGDNRVFFRCNAGSLLTIESVRILSGNQKDDDESLYRGPDFDSLDDTLQDALLDFLKVRGIGEDTSFFICSFARDKEEREYHNWLKKFINFTE